MSEIDDLEATVWLGRARGGFMDPRKLSAEERHRRGYLGSSQTERRPKMHNGNSRRPEPSLPKFKCLED